MRNVFVAHKSLINQVGINNNDNLKISRYKAKTC